jgi:1-acyl-sn-glycerol-3-phosphate acyltransferase
MIATSHQHLPVDDDFDAHLFTKSSRLLDRFTRWYFRFRLRGAERLPVRPVIIAGNHSAHGIVDVLTIQAGYYRAFGLGRRATAMMHDFYIGLPLIGSFYRKLGVRPAARQSARDAIAAGHDLLCYPGGDYDAGRPVHAHREVRFRDRRGYIKLALETGAPIVPLATIGSHFSYVVLPGGEAIARWFRLHKLFRTHCVPLTAGMIVAIATLIATIMGLLWWPITLLVLLLCAVPLPVRVTSELLEPIDVAAASAHIDDERERVEFAHALVHTRLQRAVAAMVHDQEALRHPAMT